TGKLTPASDVYSLGIILYEMLSGSVPFTAETPLAIALRHVSEAPQPLREIVPSIPPRVEAIVERALSKNPVDRFTDANELRRELHTTAQELGLEHADTAQNPSIEELRTAGSESPSGRLVIDLATLREMQARSSGELGSVDAAKASLEAGQHPHFDRVNVSLESPDKNLARRRYAVLAMIAVIAVVAIAAVASRWWSPAAEAPAITATVVQPSPSPTPEPSASPSPSPSPKKAQRKPPPKKQSKFGS